MAGLCSTTIGQGNDSEVQLAVLGGVRRTGEKGGKMGFWGTLRQDFYFGGFGGGDIGWCLEDR